MSDERAAVQRWLAGQRAAAEADHRQRAFEGPHPARAVAQAESALRALEAMGRWPGPRDPVSQRAVERVRERWARIQRHARQTRA